MKPRLLHALVLILAPGLPALAAQEPVATPSAPRLIRDRIHVFEMDRGLITRRHPLRGSPAQLDALESWMQGVLASLRGLDPRSMNADEKIDHLLFLDHCKAALEGLHRERELSDRIRKWIPACLLIERLVEGSQRLEDLDEKATLADLSNTRVRTQLTLQALEDPEVKKPDGILARQVARRCDEYRRALEAWIRGREGFDPAFSWWLPAEARKLAAEVEKLGKRMRVIAEKAGGKLGILGRPIGREALVAALRRERIAYTPEELIEIGRRELEWCRVERAKASRALGFGDDWKRALDAVKQDFVPPGRQPALIRELAEEAITFLETRRLIRIPDLAKEGWRIQMMPAARQRYTPYFTGGEVISVAYPMADMDARQKLMTMRGNNRHFSRATVFHELIPGHHLQGFMAQRHHPWRSLFRTPFLVEGWALYWELRLWDLDFAKDPKDKLGMLFWRSHRCARIIFSLSFHLGKMSPQEAIDFLVKEIGHERKNATAEVRRSFEGGYSPLYQAAYMIGGLQLRALHRELVVAGKMSEMDFHQAVLEQNSIPVSLIRARLTGHIPSPDAAPSWRFYPLH